MSNVVCYGGYYSTGGSVIRDIFREFEPAFDFSIEFRLLKERFGLFDLEDVLLRSYAPENIDLAIRDFSWLATNLARKSGRFRKMGMSYDLRTNHVFSGATKEFLDTISDYKYPMSWHFLEFEKGYAAQIASRVAKRLSKDIRRKEGTYLATLAYPGAENYFEAARKYLNTILDGIRSVNGRGSSSLVGLHNAIPPFSTQLIDRGVGYFDSCKVIIVDRDPRDIFINYPKDSYGRYLPRTEDPVEKAKAFVHFFRATREDQVVVRRHPKVLFLKFEDLCHNYDNLYDELLDFTGLDRSEHTHKRSLFEPEVSRKNIGMWRHRSGEMAKAVRYIEDQLPGFLYAT